MYSTQDRDLMEVEENFLEDYNRYEEEDWQVWVRKQQSTSAPSSLSSSLDNVEQYKIVHFFIKDLHASEQVDKNFILNGKSLLYVYLSGTIISQYDHRDKFCLIVNDGTASIICLLENNTSDKIEQEKLRLKKSTTDYYPQGNDSVLRQASWMTFRSTQRLFTCIPSKQDFHPGDIVAITGKLTEHNGKKYVFITKLMNISIREHMKNLELLLHK